MWDMELSFFYFPFSSLFVIIVMCGNLGGNGSSTVKPLFRTSTNLVTDEVGAPCRRGDWFALLYIIILNGTYIRIITPVLCTWYYVARYILRRSINQ